MQESPPLTPAEVFERYSITAGPANEEDAKAGIVTVICKGNVGRATCAASGPVGFVAKGSILDQGLRVNQYLALRLEIEVVAPSGLPVILLHATTTVYRKYHWETGPLPEFPISNDDEEEG